MGLTEFQIERIIKRWGEGASIRVIANEIGVTKPTVQRRVNQYLGKCPPATKSSAPITDAEKQAIFRLSRQGKKPDTIAKIIGCTRGRARHWWCVAVGKPFYSSYEKTGILQLGEKRDVPPPAHIIAERDERIKRAPRDLTAAFFGDPLPGYSALDRRA